MLPWLPAISISPQVFRGILLCYSRRFASLGRWWRDIDRLLWNSERARASALNGCKYSLSTLLIQTIASWWYDWYMAPSVFLYVNLSGPKRFANSANDMSESLHALTYCGALPARLSTCLLCQTTEIQMSHLFCFRVFAGHSHAAQFFCRRFRSCFFLVIHYLICL